MAMTYKKRKRLRALRKQGITPESGRRARSRRRVEYLQRRVMVSEFIEYLRPRTMIERIPSLRRVPFNETRVTLS